MHVNHRFVHQRRTPDWNLLEFLDEPDDTPHLAETLMTRRWPSEAD